MILKDLVFGTHIFILLFVGVLKNLLSSKALVNVNKYHEKMYILGITFLKVCTLHIRLYKHRTWFLVVVFFLLLFQIPTPLNTSLYYISLQNIDSRVKYWTWGWKKIWLQNIAPPPSLFSFAIWQKVCTLYWTFTK